MFVWHFRLIAIFPFYEELSDLYVFFCGGVYYISKVFRSKIGHMSPLGSHALHALTTQAFGDDWSAYIFLLLTALRGTWSHLRHM